MKPIVIATSTGRVGAQLCRALDARGAPWIGLTRNAERARSDAARDGFVPTHGRWSTADSRRPDSFAPALANAHGFFLASADDPSQDSIETAMLQIAQRQGAAHVVKLSAQSAGLTPPVSFGRQHARVEATLQCGSTPWTILRPVFFLQSLLFFSGPIRKGALPAPTGNGRVAFVDAGDVAHAAAAVLTSPAEHAGRIYTLTGPHAHSFADVASVLSERLPRRVRHVSPPAFVARLALPLGTGMPRWQANLVVELLQAIARGAQANPTGDLQRLIGRMPTGLDNFVARNIDAFR